MAWNRPGNNRQDRDPCGNSKNSSPKKNSKKNDQNQEGTPDLEDFFKKINKRICNFFSKKKKNGSSENFGKKVYFNISGQIIGMIIITIVISWSMSGFYTIKESERGIVTRFGKFSHLVDSGLNWKPTFIDSVFAVNIELVRELITSGVMLTSDENIVRVKINVQYRVTDPRRYLFSVNNVNDSLRQANDSTLRKVIGKYTMDRILVESHTVILDDIQQELEKTILPYDMGITLTDINFQSVCPPKELKSVFDDEIAARENKQQYIREAEAYANEVKPRANGQAQRILEDARAYRTKTILEAQGEVSRFSKILPEYKAAPKITRKRLYIETMEKILSRTRKILVNGNLNENLMILSLDQILKNNNVLPVVPVDKNRTNNLPNLPSVSVNSSNANVISSSYSDDIMNQRRINAQRNNYQRQEK